MIIPKYFLFLSVAAMDEDPIREWILSEGKATQITKISSIGGGCINLASRYDTDAGSFFVKTNRYLTYFRILILIVTEIFPTMLLLLLLIFVCKVC